MGKKALFIWIFLLIFGFTSMPEVGLSNTSKLTGKTEMNKKKPRKKVSKKKTFRKKVSKKKSGKKSTKKSSKKKKKSRKKTSYKKKKGSKNKRSAGKKKYTKKRKGSKRTRRVSHRRTYTPPTNSSSVEYRNYQRNNTETPEQSIENIAPPKEIKKDPKKEGE